MDLMILLNFSLNQCDDIDDFVDFLLVRIL